MGKRFVWRCFVQESTQLGPTISVLPTNHQQVFVNSIAKVLEDFAVVSFVSLRRLLVIPGSRILAMDHIPVIWFYVTLIAYSLPVVMSFQTGNVRFSIFPARQNEFTVRKYLVQLSIDFEPRPVFKRFELPRLLDRRREVIPLHLISEIHVKRAMLETKTSKAISERRCSRLRQAY